MMGRRITLLNRILLLCASLLAAYQVDIGIEGLGSLPILFYSIGFGVLLVAGILMIILGLDVLESSLVVILSTIIPLSLSLGLVAEFMPQSLGVYLTFSLLGLLAIIFTRYFHFGKTAVIVLAMVHGVAGLLICGLPIFLSLAGKVFAGFAWVGVGGAFMGTGGLLLFFMKTGSPVLSRNRILSVFPALYLLTTATFVVGFALA